jgi:hypothetical protein
MTTGHILALLIAERDKLNRAIEALGTPVKRRGRPAASAKVAEIAEAAAAKPKRKISTSSRKRMAAAQKKRWADKKAAEK